MSFIPFENTVRCAVRYTCEGKNLVNTLWFHKLGGFIESDAAALADELDGWAAGYIMPQMATTVVYQEVTVYDMRTPDSFVIINDDNTGAPGTNVGNVLPLNAAMTVTFITARRGRSYRGRNYVSGLVEGAATGTLFTVLDTTAVENAYQELRSTDITSLGWAHCVASAYQNGVPLLAGVTTHVTDVRGNRVIHKMGGRTR